MDTAELEQLLEGGTETQTFDVKAAAPCKIGSLAKDIMAMANCRDGGRIIIGVEDGTFHRTGVDEAVRSTYDQDTMRDRMAAFADPYVTFTVTYPTDRHGLTYVAIAIESFREIPVICSKDSEDTKTGAIYYRTTHRRPESAPVKTSYDMRDIIRLASARTRQGFEAVGYSPQAVDNELQQKLDNELGDL